MHCRTLLLLLCLLATTGAVRAQPARADSASAQHILLLYSYGHPGKGVQLFNDGLIAALNTGGLTESGLYFEHLDLGAHESKDYAPRLRDFLLRKYRDRRIDLIITVQQPARAFLLSDLAALAPEAAAITVQAPLPTPAEAGRRRVVASLPRFDIKGTLESALQLFPATKRLLIVAGASTADRRVEAEAEAIAAPWKSRLAVETSSELTLAQLLVRVAKLPPQSVIMFTQYNKDKSGRTLLSYEAEAMIAKVANAPVFGLYDFNLKNGGIGGSVSSVKALGENTGELALQILAGKFRFEQQVTGVEQPFLRSFDWQQIERWGGDASRLPADTLFVNRAPSFWQRYKEYSIAVILVVLAQSLSIAALLINRRHRRRAERAVAEQLREREAIFQNAVVGIAMLRQRSIVTCNGRLEELFGYAPATLDGRSTRIFWPSDESYEAFGQRAYSALEDGTSYSEELLLCRADGRTFWASVTGRALDPRRPQEGSIWIYNDINERRLAEERVQFLAYHDALTHLPNRLLAQDRFGQAVAFADRSKTRLALIFLDLDNFKTINDSLGHAIGDGLLRLVAVRLEDCVRESDTISRQGGDEFLILLTDLSDAEATAPVLGKMLERLQQPFHVEGTELGTSASIGIALYPDDGGDFETLFKKADTAMYRAKDAGGNIYRFFDEQMNVEAVERLSMRNGLRRAIDQDEFVLHYQPQIDLTSGAVVGAEALLRWRHPEFGLLAPGRFIAMAEESRLIVPMGEWILKEACRQAQSWQRAGLPPLTMAVNLSAVQFTRGDLEQTVVSALEESGYAAAGLELELTESILIGNTANILGIVKRLKSLGLSISIDDFGTGYSSLSYLKRFAVDKLKIDQSFVRDLATDPEDAAIVQAVIQMAKSLGLVTIAEGVEDESMLERLRHYGCNQAQGFLFARPLPPAEFAAHVQARQL